MSQPPQWWLFERYTVIKKCSYYANCWFILTQTRNKKNLNCCFCVNFFSVDLLVVIWPTILGYCVRPYSLLYAYWKHLQVTSIRKSKYSLDCYEILDISFISCLMHLAYCIIQIQKVRYVLKFRQELGYTRTNIRMVY